jgi:hypothetical protein
VPDVDQQTINAEVVNFKDFDTAMISFNNSSLPSRLQDDNNCLPLGPLSGTQLRKTSITSSPGLKLHAQLLQPSTPATYGMQNTVFQVLGDNGCWRV